MFRIQLFSATHKSFEEFRTDLDQAIERSVAASFMTRKWQGRTLHTEALSASGRIRYEPHGVYADFRLSWAAVPMKGAILQESHRILAAATGGAVERLE